MLQHKSVKEVYLCEIDKEVVDISKKYFPQFAPSFSEPRANIVIADGIKFLEAKEDFFDVIITDASDPIGPACCLYTEEYYRNLKKALRAGGIVASQGESIWLHLEFITNLSNTVKKVFDSVQYATMTIPTYPCGQIGVLVAADRDLREPAGDIDDRVTDPSAVRYYSRAIHSASFVLPKFAAKLNE